MNPIKIPNTSKIDNVFKKLAKPPIIMKIRDFETGALWDKRLFTLGNFSAITGKTKSKKTFLV